MFPTAVTCAGNEQNLTGWDVYPPNPGTPGAPQGQAVPAGGNTAGQRLYTVATMDSPGAAPGNFWEAYAPPPAPPVASPPQGLVAQTTTTPAH
jgi:hypothetical protein